MGFFITNFKDDQLTAGPQLAISQELHADKYRAKGEDFREAMNRVAYAMSDDADHYKQFRSIITPQKFLPAGRVQAAMGSSKVVTAHNCFVSGVIEDSFIEGNGSIMGRATEAAATMRMGGGIGYDFSTLRPRGDLIKKLDSRSSGPVSFMSIFNAVCECIASSGHRRGAQMGVMRIDHPDIEEFIHAKQNNDALEGFNMSIAVTDKFMECMQTGEAFPLEWDGRVYKMIDANDLWETIMRSTWDWAEPGVLFIDTINNRNNLNYCETITATNPCGEQPLPPFGACLLGSFNLVKYLILGNDGYYFDYEAFIADIYPTVRAMDNVIDRATYPLDAQREEAVNKRRMGLGVSGMANAIEAMGFPYGSKFFLEVEDKILGVLSEHCYLASIELAKEKGSFPLFDKEKYLASVHVQSLSQRVQDGIRLYGIRNSHLTSIAPTGTISLTADNISSGCEPVFALEFDRPIKEFDGVRIEKVQDYGYRVFGVRGKVASKVTIEEHLAVLAIAAKHMDSAVSKTCNIPEDCNWEDFKKVYMTAWETGCKGVTTFRANGKRTALLVEEPEITEEAPQACYIDAQTGRHECE